MKSKNYLILLFIFCGSIAKSQSKALLFNGIDDYASITINNPTSSLNSDNFMFEAIINPNYTGNDMTILSFPQNFGEIRFGITSNGQITFSINGEIFSTELQYDLYDGECHNIGYGILNADLHLFYDGSFAEVLHLNGVLPAFSNTQNLYLGMSYPDQSTAFSGIIDEIRMWPSQRNLSTINSYVFTTPTIDIATESYFVFDFWEGGGTLSIDQHIGNPDNTVNWENLEWVETCMSTSETDQNKVTRFCAPPVLPSNPFNMICNGNFEQYNPSLLNSQAGPQFPYMLVSGLTDIINWIPKQTINNFQTPDFYVRNGVGGIPYPLVSIPGSPSLSVDTWDANPNNTAMTGLGSYGSGYTEGIGTEKLLADAYPGKSYEFSGRFFTANSGAAANTQTHQLRLTLRNTITGNTLNSIPLVNLTNHNLTNTNNGWEYISHIFHIPGDVQALSYDQLIIQTESNGISGSYMYTFLDDLSLLEICSRDADHFLTYIESHIAFPSLSVVSNKTIVINNTLDITQDLEFENCHIYMGANAKINVVNGAKLSLTAGTIIESCDGTNMWDGIELLNGSSVYCDDATIMDAKTAILSPNGEDFQVFRSRFENNYIGIHAQPIPGQTHTGIIEHTAFTTTSTLLHPYNTLSKGLYAVYMEDVGSFTFGNPNTPITERNNVNLFEYGIMSYHSNLTVHNSVFSRCEYGVYVAGETGMTNNATIGVSGKSTNQFLSNYCGLYIKDDVSISVNSNSFAGNEAGISIRYHSRPTSTYIENNQMSGNDYGIIFKETYNSNIYVAYNRVTGDFGGNSHTGILYENTVSQSGTWIPTPPQGSFSGHIEYNEISHYNRGLYIKNVFKPIIQYNIITNVNTSNIETNGIKLSNCPQVEVFMNEIMGMDKNNINCIGLRFEFCQNSTVFKNCIKNCGILLWLGGMNTGIKVHNNYFKDAVTGVQANWGYFGIQTKKEIINTGSSSIIIQGASDNEWAGQITNHFNSEFGFNGNEFELRDEQSYDWNSKHYNSNFVTNLSNGTYAVIMDPVHINQYFAYPYTDYNVSYAGCLNIGYKTNPLEFETNSISTVANDIANSQIISDVNHTMRARKFLLEKSIFDVINTSEQQIDNEITNTFISDFTFDKEIREISMLNKTIANYTRSQSDQYKSRIDELSSNLIKSDRLPVQTYAKYQKIYLRYAQNKKGAKNNKVLLNGLKEIADECSYIHGPSVYEARALYDLLTDSIHNYTENCDKYADEITLDNQKKVYSSISTLHVYPNPASSILNIESNGGLIKGYNMYNAAGHKIIKANNVYESKAIINTKSLSDGLYVIQVFKADHSIESIKVVIKR